MSEIYAAYNLSIGGLQTRDCLANLVRKSDRIAGRRLQDSFGEKRGFRLASCLKISLSLSNKNPLSAPIEYVTIFWYEKWFPLTSNKGGKTMAKVCFYTGRKAVSGNKRSHSMRKSKRRFGANLQKVRVMIDGKEQRVWVSARALKSGKVERA